MNSPNLGKIVQISRLTRLRLSEIFKGTSLWLILAGTSFLTGFSFLQGALLYGEASHSAVGAPGLITAINPFDGIFVPIFGAFYLVQTMILPFLVVGIFAGEKQSGAHKLNYLAPWSRREDFFSKLLTYFVVWLLVILLPLSTLIFWQASGGHIYFLEILNLVFGHFLYGLIIFSISLLSTSLTASGATAAIFVLTLTLGSWILDFVANTQSGWMNVLSSLSLTAQIRSFETGLLDLGYLVKILLLFSSFVICGLICELPTKAGKNKLVESATVLLICALVFVAIPTQKYSYDMTEDRRHSFDKASESALKSLSSSLDLHIGLSPDDSRFKDYNRSILRPLIRSVPHLNIEFEKISMALKSFAPGETDSYGIITYSFAGHFDQSRSTSPEEVLQIIFKLAKMKIETLPEAPYPGYPLEFNLSALKIFYYLIFPLIFLIIFSYIQRKKILEVIGNGK